MTFGLTTFLEIGVDPKTGMTTHAERINQSIEEIVLADKVGLNYYGIGEHHRMDYAASSPQTILAAAAKLTKKIHLGSAVTVLSSEDPVRIYQEFATLDILTDGRAEIMAGRGSFIESFPLFGYALEDYNTLFSEKLEMLLRVREAEHVKWPGGKHTQKLNGEPVYPRSVQSKLKVSIAVGGTQTSVIRAAKLGLPIVFAIIGGEPIRFKPLVDLYKHFYLEAGHDMNEMEIGVHSHGIVTDENPEELVNRYYEPHHAAFSKLGQERGWGIYTKQHYLNSIQYGPLYVGDVDFVAKKIAKTMKDLGINRFLLHTPGSYMPHQDVLKSIEVFGLQVVPKVKELLK
ncbi:LLM class flavin-dependent oxidoreductase [Acholeplasma equirhinis]|uniref:LLM class flavin-dependent oxidoreductase n=1 Tax=Acholeplasma equirhinis TaxID=555393 RepID=UPI001F09CCB9|nr:LLM class flavin-dependent oxidoreductase [Acholeplasma equirhinis]